MNFSKKNHELKQNNIIFVSKKQLQLLILFLSLGIYTTSFSQGFSRYINYQGVASNADGEVMANETITVGIALNHVIGTNQYAENHSVTTDANGVFSLKIGNGTAIAAPYYDFEWSDTGVELTVSINGNEIGTTEMQAVPFALSSGDTKHWIENGTEEYSMITDNGYYRVKVNSHFLVGGDIRLKFGPAVNEISTDGTLADNSDEAIPTEKAVKTYVDANGGSGLEKITEEGKTGWRLIGAIPADYNNIGENAVDLSINNGQPTGGASGSYSFTSGSETTASAQSSTAMGSRTIASGISSTAMGASTSAIGRSSIAMGSGSRAFADYSIAMGWETNANGDRSTTMGNMTTASGKSSIAMGFESHAVGRYSTAMGQNTNASGESSTSIGKDTKAASFNSLAVGRNNIGGGNAESWMPLDPLFEIGNGVDGPSNALTVLKNGNIGIDISEPKVKLHITGGSDTALGDDAGFMVIGAINSQNIVMDGNEILARSNGNTSTLHLQYDGGNVSVGGSVVHSSDKRLKKDITELSYGLEEVLQLRPVSYYWKNREQKHKSLGLIAQEVQPIIKELVHTDSDKDKTLSLSYTELVPILIKAIQEQQTIIDGQNTKIESLSVEVGTTKKDLANLLTRVIVMEKEKMANN